MAPIAVLVMSIDILLALVAGGHEGCGPCRLRDLPDAGLAGCGPCRLRALPAAGLAGCGPCRLRALRAVGPCEQWALRRPPSA